MRLKRFVGTVSLVVLLLSTSLVAGLPTVRAQAPAGADPFQFSVEIIGEVTLVTGTYFRVGTTDVMPPAGFDLTTLLVGDIVRVQGNYLTDGDTLGATLVQVLTDLDNDGVPDVGDNCPAVPNPLQEDSDLDGIGDACDLDPVFNDVDGDGVGDGIDNCLMVPNPDQADADLDGIGDACQPDPTVEDIDEDGIADGVDNCPFTYNPDQADEDEDGVGDRCDDDDLDDDDDEDDPALIAPTESAGCQREGHPVGTVLANEFDVSYDEIMDWHCRGFGFGEISRALLLAEAREDEDDDDDDEPLDWEGYLELKGSGLGWGQIVKDSGVHPSLLAQGRVISGHWDRDHNGELDPAALLLLAQDREEKARGRATAPGQIKDKDKDDKDTGKDKDKPVPPGQGGENPGRGNNKSSGGGDNPGKSGNPPGQSKAKKK